VLGVLHLKGFVFDDTLLYSGASLNDVYLQNETRYRYDRYHVIKNQPLCDSFVRFLQSYIVNSNAVKALTEENIPDKKQLKPSIKQLKRKLRVGDYAFQPEQDPAASDQVSITPMIGFGGRKNILNRTILEMVKNTESELTIYTPYFNLPRLVNRHVRRILTKGKTVNLVIGDKTANDFYIPEEKDFNKIGIVPYVYETNLRTFVKRNQKFIDSGLLNVYLWRHDANSFHLKGISCDSCYYLITGHNLNPRACNLDLENGILIQDPNELLKEKFQAEYHKILNHTTRVKHFNEIETINDYPEAAKKLMRSVKRAKLDSILNRLL